MMAMAEDATHEAEVYRLRLRGARVEVLTGKDVGAAANVGHDGATIGSSASADLQLSDPLVSRAHLTLHAEKDGVRLVDRGSRNGTRIGGVRIHEAMLDKDTLIEVGDTTVVLRLLAQPLDLALSKRTQFGSAIGRSAAMRHVFSLLEGAAESDATVLIEGDSGTGKDVLATSLHDESTRADGPFVVVDCGALPKELVESELFGHEAGAFSGALSQRRGAFELAHGGTVFLDEVGELPVSVQPKLLRVLESRAFRRVGGSEMISVDVRVVAATNRRLREAVREGEFREDLYYRLAVIGVWVPPLAARREDIVPLAKLFLKEELPPELSRLLSGYPFPRQRARAAQRRRALCHLPAHGRSRAVSG